MVHIEESQKMAELVRKNNPIEYKQEKETKHKISHEIHTEAEKTKMDKSIGPENYIG